MSLPTHRKRLLWLLLIWLLPGMLVAALAIWSSPGEAPLSFAGPFLIYWNRDMADQLSLLRWQAWFCAAIAVLPLTTLALLRFGTGRPRSFWPFVVSSLIGSIIWYYGAFWGITLGL